MELRHLKYFLTLSEELHFRRAAEKLFIAQPALTRQIKVLEEELGAVLFKRDRRNVSLTLAGRYLQQEGYQLLKKVDMIKASVADFGSVVTGVLNIGSIGSAMVSILPSLINSIGEEYPKVKTNIVESTTLDLLHQLQDGQLDLILGRPHKSMKQIHSEKIYTDSAVLVTAVNTKWGVSKKSKLVALKDVPLILYPRSAGTFFRDCIVSACGKQGFYPIIKHESIQALSILKLVEKDIGVSIIPRSILTECHLEVQYFELKELKITLDTVVSYRTDIEHELPKAIAEIIKNEIPIIR